MSTKLTYEEVKKSFEKEGYTLLSTDYLTAKSLLSYKCPGGHEHKINYNNWKYNKRRCPYCVNLGKPNIDYIREAFDKEGYILLSVKYINNRDKLEYICNNKHKHSISWSNWLAGYRCPYCVNSVKDGLISVKLAFEKEGYTILSTEYVNAHTKLDYICPNGHTHNINWHNWKTGQRCYVCAYIKTLGPNSRHWKGGFSNGDYCPVWRDKEYKTDIKDRDNNRCLNPYCNSKHPEKLVIHHINYDKQDCHFKNLITVCNECNLKANHDRDWHQDWYQAILKQRYNYNY